MNLCILGSSSAGNCTVVWDDAAALLIDCGLRVRDTKAGLEGIGLGFDKLDGVLITHSHGDHVYVSMLNTLLKHAVPIVCHERVAHDLDFKHRPARRARKRGLVHTFGNPGFRLGGFDVEPFPVPHDEGMNCFGFRISRRRAVHGVRCVTIATDLGRTDGLKHRFVDSDVVVIESNHDVEMEAASGRPQHVIDRAYATHLNNDQCAAFAAEVARSSLRPPQAIVLAHISQDCNTHRRASTCTRLALSKAGLDIPVVLTHPDRPSDIIRIV